jgi:hypothetical protein
MEIPEHLPVECREALKLIQDSGFDLGQLHPYFKQETGEFHGIHFIGPGGKITRFAEPKLAAALRVLDSQIRMELAESVK